jgi:KDO2-lipid IV(A) lauroyltransferase
LQKVVYKFEYWIFIILKIVYLRLSERGKEKFLNIFSKIAFFILKKYRLIVKKNLEIVFGIEFAEKNYLLFTKKCIGNLFLNILTIIENLHRSRDELANLIIFENEDFVKDLISKKSPFILSSAHFGNWEIMGAGINSLLASGYAVVENLKNPYLDKILIQSRSKMGVKVVPMRGALRGLIKGIKEGKAVMMLMDQSLNKNYGFEYPLFGKMAIHTETNAFLSIKYNLPIVQAYIRSENGKYFIRFEKPIFGGEIGTIEGVIKEELAILENRVRENPESWLWCHRRWKNHKGIYQK